MLRLPVWRTEGSRFTDWVDCVKLVRSIWSISVVMKGTSGLREVYLEEIEVIDCVVLMDRASKEDEDEAY